MPKNESYIITVSPQVGCYRHLRVDSEATLYDLSEGILGAFDFVDDHAHAFFMNNRGWDLDEAYYCPEIYEEMHEDGENPRGNTENVTLKELRLNVGRKFLYIFDFGEEWRFACKVLKVLPERTEDCEIVRSVGRAPDQYGFDEDGYDDDDEDDE